MRRLKDRINFVDKSAASDKLNSGRFEKVASAAPPGIVSEALRQQTKGRCSFHGRRADLDASLDSKGAFH